MRTDPWLAVLLATAAVAGVGGLAGIVAWHPGEAGAFAPAAFFVAAVLAAAALLAAP